MLPLSAVLSGIRQLEMKVGSTLYQVRKQREEDNDAHSHLSKVLRVMDEVQQELARLSEN